MEDSLNTLWLVASSDGATEQQTEKKASTTNISKSNRGKKKKNTTNTTTRAKKKYKKPPNAPKRFKSAYMFFSISKHAEIRNNKKEKAKGGGQVAKTKAPNAAKTVSRSWKELSSKQRKEFEEMARKDKIRYEVEKEMYDGPWKVSPDEFKKLTKDPNKPKRPMSSYLAYANSKRTEVKSKYPTLNNTEVSRKLAEMWKGASDEEKKYYIDEESRLRQIYLTAVAEYNENKRIAEQTQRKQREDYANSIASHRLVLREKEGTTMKQGQSQTAGRYSNSSIVVNSTCSKGQYKDVLPSSYYQNNEGPHTATVPQESYLTEASAAVVAPTLAQGGSAVTDLSCILNEETLKPFFTLASQQNEGMPMSQHQLQNTGNQNGNATYSDSPHPLGVNNSIRQPFNEPTIASAQFHQHHRSHRTQVLQDNCLPSPTSAPVSTLAPAFAQGISGNNPQTYVGEPAPYQNQEYHGDICQAHQACPQSSQWHYGASAFHHQENYIPYAENSNAPSAVTPRTATMQYAVSRLPFN